MNQDRIFTIIYGPTASGKTSTAYEIAGQEANLLSYDSRHVYQDMNIVTGKDIHPDAYPVEFCFSPGKTYTVYAHHHITDSEPFLPPHTLERLTDWEKGVPSLSRPHLFGVDILPVNEPFSIRHFYEYARPIIEAHREQHKPLVIFGGSWQYAQVLIDPPQSLWTQRNDAQRENWLQLPVEKLQELVQSKNADRWERMNTSDRANPRRLIRALEQSFSGDTGPVAPPLLKKEEYVLEILNPDQEILESRIQERIEKRLTAGALEETQLLLQKYPDWSWPAFSSTGYQILRQHLEQTLSLPEATQLWFLQERQYVKRQKTWIKKILGH